MPELLHRVRPSAGEAEGLLVLLHGRGADENDLYPLLDVLDPDGRLLGVTPRAPIAIPPGYHWYITREVGFPDPLTFHRAYKLLAEWIGGFMQGQGLRRLFLGGFSMGAVMSYALALGAELPPPAALFIFSGFIPTVEGFIPDPGNLEKTPVLIGHGAFDPVMEPKWGRLAKGQLEQAGVPVTHLETPMAHSIDPAAIELASTWITEILESK